MASAQSTISPLQQGELQARGPAKPRSCTEGIYELEPGRKRADRGRSRCWLQDVAENGVFATQEKPAGALLIRLNPCSAGQSQCDGRRLEIGTGPRPASLDTLRLREELREERGRHVLEELHLGALDEMECLE